jgi:glutamate racemase
VPSPHPQWPDRRDLHPCDRRVAGVRRRVRGRAADHEPGDPGLPALVEFVEAGETSGPDLLAAAHEYLDPLVDQRIDTLILGCTHYPLLTGVISYVLGDDVTLVSSAEETAKDVYRVLVARGLDRGTDALGVHRFLTTGQPGEFEVIGRRFLGPELEQVSQFAWIRA